MEKKLVVIIPSYNNSKWYERNLNSVFSQDYKNYKVLYTDDCSPDGTGNLVEEFKNKNNLNFELIKNTTRKGAMENIYNMVYSCEDDEIILTLDGDDHFAHSGVLKKISDTYSDNFTWMTWGQYKDSHGGVGCSKPIPQSVINSNSYRSYQWCSSHLRTFYTWLFKKIKKEDLMYNGKFAEMGWDCLFQFAMLEMSGEHGKFIKDILYVYNTENPINDSKVNIKLQQEIEMHARRVQKPYSRL